MLRFFNGAEFESRIITTSDINIALVKLPRNSLLLLDLDNCVITTDEPLAKDEYFIFLVKDYLAKGIKLDEAQEKANQLFNAMQYLAKHHGVDTKLNLAALIKKLQKNGVIVLGLTARAKSISDITHKQLNQLGIEFSHPEIRADFLFNDKTISFNGGVIFCHEQSKGKCLELAQAFLPQYLTDFSYVRFVDDKLSNLKTVKASLEKLKIPHSVCLYDFVKQYYPFDKTQLEMAKTQHDIFLETGNLICFKELYSSCSAQARL